MNSGSVPLNRVHLTGDELRHIGEAIASGALSGPGAQSAYCEAVIRRAAGAPWAAIVPSCTAALEMSAVLLDLGPGDEVVMPSFTFVSTAAAVALRGAVPVFVDVDPVTLNICPEAAAAAVTARTRAIFAVHYAGVVADMDALARLAHARGLALVEDAAQAYGSTRGGRPAGSFGTTACFSFHGTKNVTSGEGGALVVNDPALVERAGILRDRGTDRERFLRGQVNAYSWQDIGSSQIVSEITAAFLRAQLDHADAIRADRLSIWQGYAAALAEPARQGQFRIPAPPPETEHNGHIFFLMLPDARSRLSLGEHLARRGIVAAPHYVPLHSSPAGRRFGRPSGPMTVTDHAADCLLRLPLWVGLGGDQDRVIDGVLDWCAGRREAA